MGRKSFYLILSIFVLLSSKGFSQQILQKNISVKAESASVPEIINLIEEQAKIKIAFSNEILGDKLYSFSVKKPVYQILEMILPPDVVYELVGGIMVLRRKVNDDAEITIRGTVKDETGQEMPGVSVFYKGTSLGTSTDQNGDFALTIPSYRGTIVFTSVGYNKTEINPGGSQYLNIVLTSSEKSLEEVVVIGYGSQKRMNITGAVSTIGSEEILQTPSASLQNVLLGKLPGFYSQQRSGQPGKDGADFFVRGVSTYNGNQSPLILVDDIEFSYEDFAAINPNDVQSLSILKDAATTAVYGIKGANGVILITTRRGTPGAAKINFKTEASLQVPTHVPRFLDAATTASLRNEALINSGLSPEFTNADIELYRNGSDPYNHPNINWYNELFRKSSPMANSNLDISGGTDNVKYFASLGFLTQEGMLKSIRAADNIDNNYGYKRYNLRSNLDFKVTRSLGLRLDLSGTNSIANAPRFSGVSGSGETAAFYEVLNYESLNPYIYNIYNPDGSYGYADPNHTQPSGNANNIIGRIAYGGYTRAYRNLLNMNVSATQKLNAITDGLEARVLVSVSNSNASQKRLNRINFPSFFYNTSNGNYIPRDPTIFRVDPFSLMYDAGSPRRQSTVQANLRYDRKFGKNYLNGLILYNQNSKVQPHVVNEVLQYDSYIPLNFRGYTFRAGYNFDNRYLFEFNGSYNGTTRFSPANRYGFFPALSAGWNIANERFLTKYPILTQLKLRASYGIVGSDDLGNFNNSYIDSYIRSGTFSFGTTAAPINTIVPGTIGNPNVSWEKERKIDVGLDFSFGAGRINGTMDFFTNQRYDILTQRQTIPLYFGLPNSSLPPENIGRVKNSGFEAEISYNSKPNKNWQFHIESSYSYARNTILAIDEVDQRYSWKRQTGQPIGSITEWIWDGFYSVAEANDPSVPKYIGSSFTTPGFLKYRDMNGDGVISDDDKGYFGNPNLPNTVLSLNTAVNFKRFGLNILVQSALNYDVQIGYQFATPFKANLQEIHLKRWTPQTAATAEFPTLVSNFHGTYMSSGSSSTFWAISGNYVRLKSLEFSYRIPEKLIGKVGLKAARIYASGYNLITLSKTFEKYGLDPEVARSSSASTTNGIYPQQTIFNLGFNIALK